MLNKLKFNNLVISSKKDIQKSRIQTINKLVGKIRKLKTSLEKYPDKTKCKDRIRKSMEAMELLKKQKRMDMMGKVLLMDKAPSAIITNGLATPEEFGIALLCMNKIMQGLIKRFKAELQLDETKKSEWREILMEASKRKQKIKKTEEKRHKRLEMKRQKEMGRKRQEWLEQNQGIKEGGKNECEMNISTTESWLAEELSNSNKEGTEQKQDAKVILRRPLNQVHTSQHTPIPYQIEKENIKKGENKNEKEHDEEKGEVIESKTATLKEHLTEFGENESHYSSEEVEETLVVDPFFITDTGENYLSTAIIKRDQQNADSNDGKRDLYMIKLNNYNKKFDKNRSRHQQPRNKNRKDFREKEQPDKSQFHKETNSKWSETTNHNNKLRRNEWNDKKDIRNNNFKHQKSLKDSNSQNLHPSWAAKQKLKPVITDFQGKKIKFGDDEGTIEAKPINAEQDILHPSWAAKQKLKYSITAFQGRKITFDNND